MERGFTVAAVGVLWFYTSTSDFKDFENFEGLYDTRAKFVAQMNTVLPHISDQGAYTIEKWHLHFCPFIIVRWEQWRPRLEDRF